MQQTQEIIKQEEIWTLPEDETKVSGRRHGNNIEYVTIVYAPDLKTLNEKIEIEGNKNILICITAPYKEKREYRRVDRSYTYHKKGKGSYYYSAGLYWLKEHKPQVINREVVIVNEDIEDCNMCDSCGQTTNGKIYMLVSKKKHSFSAFCGKCKSDLKKARKQMEKRQKQSFHIEQTIGDLFLVKTAIK